MGEAGLTSMKATQFRELLSPEEIDALSVDDLYLLANYIGSIKPRAYSHAR